MVLISTYWNVNFSSENLSLATECVLISTYWNVNADIIGEEVEIIGF